MATESPIRMPETSGKWPRHREAAIFVPSTSNMAAEELGMLQKPHMIHGNGRDVVPNRSGSAPPSMEGSFLAMDDLSCQQNLSMNPSLPSLNGAADPSYLAYYASNVNLNPRICPTRMSWENQRPVFHGKFGNNWGLTSIDDGGNSSFHMSQGALSIHKEESEDDSSPQYSCDGILDQTSRFWSGHDAAPLAQNLVQEDSSHTSSPVYMQPGFLSHKIIEESGVYDADSSSLRRHTQSLSSALASPVGSENVGLSSDASFSSLSSRDCTEIKPSAQTVYEGVLNGTDIHAKNEMLVGSVRNSDIRSIICDIKNLNISNLPNLENQEAQEQRQHNCQNVLPQHQTHQQQSNSFEVQSSKSQMSSQGVNGAHIGMDQFLHKPSKLSLEVQPVLQCSGLTPPLYATAAAYMTSPNPFYPNVQAPNLYSPQYGVGEYPLTSVFHPFFTGYIPQSAIPLVFEGTAGPNFNVQMSGVSSGGSVVHAVDIQNFSKFYGQVGFTLQPSFADPNYMQYYQQTLGQSFNMPGQIDQSAARGGVSGNRKSVLDLQKGSDDGTSLDNQKFYNQRSGQGNQNPCQVDIMNPHYYGNQPNVGILMQYPSSPLASPILPGSPSGGTTLPGGRNEMRYPPGSGRFAGAYSEWQGQRARESFNDSKVCNLLQDLKSGKGRRFDLPDIAGHIVEFSTDQHGSRFIQQKLENCGVEEKGFVFKEVLPHASTLMTDVFGNYVIQKFFEYGSSEQRKELANQLTGQILPLSLQMYGCRVIQKALEVVELEQKAQLVHELDGHVMRCVRDQNGNHVIQKCIESVPTDKIGFIISAFRSQVATLSMHPYGCRVIQRVLERCTCEHQCKFIVDEILDSVCALAQDQYGNYVMQHVLERGKPDERGRIISKLTGHIVQLSQHKFASNVIEKCLEYGGPSERDLIIEEIVGQNEASDNLFTMMKDQFANYVVQKIVEISTDDQRAMLLSRIRTHAHALKKYTYGKHIVARFEQLFGEDSQASGS